MTRTIGPPRGLLKLRPDAGLFHHARLPPPQALEHLVRHIWIVRWEIEEGVSQVSETLPHPNVHFVLDANGASIHGVPTGRFTRTLTGTGGVCGVKFRAGAFRPFFGRAVSELRNRTMAAESVFGAAAANLAAHALSQTDDAAMADAASHFLLARMPDADPLVEQVASIVEAVEEDRAIVRVDQLLDRWSLSKRTLQRLFREYVGVTPKWVINRYRLHEALERLHAGDPVSWSELALELGYFDQSHFIRDFRALVGCSPLQYARLVSEAAKRPA